MSRWSPRAVAVVLVALMVATATPVLAADPALEAASEHTTNADFNAALTLENVTVQNDNLVKYVQNETIDDWEDGDRLEWDDDGANPPEGSELSVNGNDVFHGGFSAELTSDGDHEMVESSSGLNHYPQAGDNFTFYYKHADTSGRFRFAWGADTSGDQLTDNKSAFYLESDITDGQLRLIDGNTVLDTAGTAAPSGVWLRVTVEWQADNDLTVKIFRTDTGAKVATLSGSGSDRNTNGLMLHWTAAGTSTMYFDWAHTTPNEPTGRYVSANHSAEQIQQAWTDLTISNASVTVQWQYWDGSTWQTADTSTYTSSGNKTVSVSGHASATKWRVVIDYSQTGGDPTATLADEGVLFNAATPSVDNSTASPSGGETITSSTMTLSIDVSDQDFALTQSDQLTVEWYVDGSKVDTTTVSSNGTASTTISTPGGSGSHTWHAVVTDDYGDATTSSTFSFDSPSTLRVVNESNVSQLVDNATVELTFYFRNGTGQDFSVTRTTSDGTVNMTGLPADQPFVVVAEADGFYSRRIFVPSLFETQTVYLLPENETAVDTVFVIEDYTGDFPPDDTVLLVQRSLNGTWKTVLGDYFGATREFPGQVAYNERHRLVLMNVETGETKVMGTYTPITAATQEVVVSPSGDLTVRTAGATAAIRPQLGQLPALNGTNVAVRFENNSASVANWTVNASVNGTVVWLQTYSSPQRVTNNLDLANHAGQTLTVRVTYNDSNGTTYLVHERTFQIQQTLDNNATLLAVIQDFAQQSPSSSRDSFTAFLAMAITVLGMAGVATQFPVSGEAVALVGVFILTGFSVIGWVGYGLVFAAGVGTIAFAGLKRGL